MLRWRPSCHHPFQLAGSRCPLLRYPHQGRENVLTGLSAASPISAAAAALAGKRHPIAALRLTARRHGQTTRWLGPKFGPTTAPERDAPASATRYTLLDQGIPPWSRPQGVCCTAGAFVIDPLQQELCLGAFIQRQGVESRVGPRKFLRRQGTWRSKTRRAAIQAEFLGALDGGTPLVRFGRQSPCVYRLERQRSKFSECSKEVSVRGRSAGRQGGSAPYQVLVSASVGRGPGTPERNGGVCGPSCGVSLSTIALNESTARFLPGCGRSRQPRRGGIGPPGRWVCWAPPQKIKNRGQHGTVSADILS